MLKWHKTGFTTYMSNIYNAVQIPFYFFYLYVIQMWLNQVCNVTKNDNAVYWKWYWWSDVFCKYSFRQINVSYKCFATIL